MRSHPPPSTNKASPSASTAPRPHAAADSRTGPIVRNTGTARTANPTSPQSAATDQAIPLASARPQPWTVKAPIATNSAPQHTARVGRRPSSAGAITATTTGAHPTKTPGTAGSEVRSAASTAMLKPTIPTPASRARRTHCRAVSARNGARPPRPVSGTNKRQATA